MKENPLSCTILINAWSYWSIKLFTVNIKLLSFEELEIYSCCRFLNDAGLYTRAFRRLGFDLAVPPRKDDDSFPYFYANNPEC